MQKSISNNAKYKNRTTKAEKKYKYNIKITHNMKKFTATLLLLFMTLTASADRFEVDGIIYESMNDTEVWISSIDNENLPEGPITIPGLVFRSPKQPKTTRNNQT